jgi:hypothetical protein
MLPTHFIYLAADLISQALPILICFVFEDVSLSKYKFVDDEDLPSLSVTKLPTWISAPSYLY